MIAAKKGTTVSDIALRYLFSSGMDVYAIVSSSNAQRLAQNAESACHPLTPDEAAFLEQDEA